MTAGNSLSAIAIKQINLKLHELVENSADFKARTLENDSKICTCKILYMLEEEWHGGGVVSTPTLQLESSWFRNTAFTQSLHVSPTIQRHAVIGFQKTEAKAACVR